MAAARKPAIRTGSSCAKPPASTNPGNCNQPGAQNDRGAQQKTEACSIVAFQTAQQTGGDRGAGAADAWRDGCGLRQADQQRINQRHTVEIALAPAETLTQGEDERRDEEQPTD